MKFKKICFMFLVATVRSKAVPYQYLWNFINIYLSYLGTVRSNDSTYKLIHSSSFTNDWYNEWEIYPIFILKMKLFFLFRNYYSIIPALGPMTDIMNDRYIHPKNENIFFISKLLQHHLMNDRYIHPQNENIFFYFETITASFQYLDQWLI